MVPWRAPTQSLSPTSQQRLLQVPLQKLKHCETNYILVGGCLGERVSFEVSRMTVLASSADQLAGSQLKAPTFIVMYGQSGYPNNRANSRNIKTNKAKI